MRATIDGNEAAASVAYRLNEVIAASTRSRRRRRWASWPTSGRPQGEPNIWGTVPDGRRDAERGRRRRRGPRRAAERRAGDDVHRVAGPAADDPQHVQDRRRADAGRASTSPRARWPTQALSIFGDHRDVMAVPRRPGFAMLCLGLGAGGAGHRARRAGGDARVARPVPALLRRLPHLARGRQDRAARRRRPARADRRASWSRAHRARALSPDRPVLRGTAQNPDVFFQAREAVQPLLPRAARASSQQTMDRFAALTGRRYHLFDYVGAPGRRARDRDDGLGRRDGARDRRRT